MLGQFGAVVQTGQEKVVRGSRGTCPGPRSRSRSLVRPPSRPAPAARGCRTGTAAGQGDDVADLVADDRLDEVDEAADQHPGPRHAGWNGPVVVIDHLQDGEVGIDVAAAEMRAAAGQSHALGHGVVVGNVDGKRLLDEGPGNGRQRLADVGQPVQAAALVLTKPQPSLGLLAGQGFQALV